MKTNRSSAPKSQYTARYDRVLFEAFELECEAHLLRPSRVIEALLIHWLSSNPQQRQEMAQKRNLAVDTPLKQRKYLQAA